MSLSILEAFDNGWRSSERGESLINGDPYGDSILFSSHKNGWKSRELRERVQRQRRNGHFTHEENKCEWTICRICR